MNIIDIGSPTSNLSGVGTKIYIKEIGAFDTIAVNMTPVAYGDERRITASHTFLDVDDGWQTALISNKQSEMLADFMGDDFTRAVKPYLQAFMPGIDPVRCQFFAELKEYLVLVPDVLCAGTRYIQIGTKCRAARIPADKVKMKGGKAESNEPRGHEFVIEGFADGVNFYEGTVTLPA
jgi:hypothetical protein